MSREDKKRLNILFPDWQGYGESMAAHTGALALAEALSPRFAFSGIEVSQTTPLTAKAGVLGLDPNLDMLRSMCNLLEAKQPDKTFMIGGTCATEIAPVSYLNKKYKGDLCVLWFDAHGDLNTPASSPSGHLHGMPLRTLLGEGHPEVLEQAFSTLQPDQVILVGTRDLDPAENTFIEENNLLLLPPQELSAAGRLTDAIAARNYNHVYVHLDLDILNPAEFPSLLVPTTGGISVAMLKKLLYSITKTCDIAGFSVVEYVLRRRDDIGIVESLVEIVLDQDA
ncbi:MAG: arginase family protein [Bacteroidota bacterium]